MPNINFPFWQPTRATVTSVSSASSLPAAPDGCEEGCKGAAEEEGKAREEKAEKRSSVGEQTGEIIVEEVDGGSTSTDLSGWQVGKREAVDLGFRSKFMHLLSSMFVGLNGREVGRLAYLGVTVRKDGLSSMLKGEGPGQIEKHTVELLGGVSIS